MNHFNIYCDESCHLPRDNSDVMVLGAVWLPKSKVQEISNRISDIKTKHNLNSHSELKWTKIAKSNLECYLSIVDYFFDDDDLHFRGLVAKEKSKLDHKGNNQLHDDWYYKMYFYLLKNILNSENKYNIFLDKKDTLGSRKVLGLHKVLCNDLYDFDKKIIRDIKTIVSHDSTSIQLADIFIGAVGFLHRGLAEKSKNSAKYKVLERIKERSQKNLIKHTLPAERKFNLFIWTPNYGKSS